MSVRIRVALVLLALSVVAWLAHGLRGTELEADAEAVLRGANPNISQAKLAATRESLRRAGRLNPDQSPLLIEGFLLRAAGKREEAFEAARQLTVKEPEDFNAWLLLYYTAPSDLIERGRLKVIELNPWLGSRLDSYEDRRADSG